MPLRLLILALLIIIESENVVINFNKIKSKNEK